MRIMIVDDNEGIRDLIKSVLSTLETEFTECEDGGMAVSQYSQVMPDWVLMDLSMEYVDGISAIEELKSMFPESRIVVVTDFGEESLRSKASEAGADAYILKEHLQELPALIYGMKP